MTIGVDTSRDGTRIGANSSPSTLRRLARAKMKIENLLREVTGSEFVKGPRLVIINPGVKGTRRELLSAAQWAHAITSIPRAASVIVDGPDALSCEYFDHILLAADRMNLDLTVATDGIGLEEKAPSIFALGVRCVRVRIFGCEEAHNSVLKNEAIAAPTA